MATYGSYFNGAQQGFGTSGWSSSAVKNLKKISPAVQNHLKRVYLSLTCALASLAVGVYLHLLWNIGGLLTGIGSIGTIIWLLSTPPTPYNEGKRVKLLMAAAALKGATMGPLVDVVIEIDPSNGISFSNLCNFFLECWHFTHKKCHFISILVSAFVGTALAFACFSASAILARRREFLFLGGILGSGVSILLWLQLAAGLFGGSMAVYTFEIYFGLLVFLGYIIFDTQMIIERADLGDYDYVKHSLDLFTDFVAVFVRLLIILAKNSEGRSEREKKKRRV